MIMNALFSPYKRHCHVIILVNTHYLCLHSAFGLHMPEYVVLSINWWTQAPWTEGGESGQAELHRKRIQIRCPGFPNAVPPQDLSRGLLEA
jgi:hypothetical protein